MKIIILILLFKIQLIKLSACAYTKQVSFTNTRGCISLTTLLVKYYNDLLDRQNSGWSRNEVTCFYVGDIFVSTLALCMPIIKKKIFPETPGKKFQTFQCSDVATMKSLELFPRSFREYFF